MSDTDNETWLPDPDVDGRKRLWRDNAWTKWVSYPDSGESAEEPYLGGLPRWQYAVVAIGAFKAAGRMNETLQTMGQMGFELVHIYDKSSNWMANLEKGFMLFKRPVPPGQRIPDDKWCLSFNMAGR